MADSFYHVISLLPLPIQSEIKEITQNGRSSVIEVRLRAGQTSSYRVCLRGTQKERIAKGSIICDKKIIDECINKFINYSYYAYEDEMKNGYITLRGGHRVGLCGHVVTENGRVRLLRNISSVNIRHAKEYPGIAAKLAPRIVASDGRIENTLLVSPPRCGKTTLLRDMIRYFSNQGYIVGVCDERSEIAGMADGLPAFDIGSNTDVMDGCPKAEGMLMLLRSMGPDVIATDEIGKEEDIAAIENALTAGTSLLATIHGGNRKDLEKSRVSHLIEHGVFQNIIFLDRHPALGSIKQMLHRDERSGKWIDY